MSGLPFLDLSRDVAVASLEFLGVVDLACIAAASHVSFFLARVAQRRPSLVTEVGNPEEVLSALGRRLAATPTMGFLFGTGDLEDGTVREILSKQLPPGCHLIGASSEELQALVQSSAQPRQSKTGQPAAHSAVSAGATELCHVQRSGQIALMLGSFPDALAQSFYMPVQACMEISKAEENGGSEAGLKVIKRLGFPAGNEWKTIVIIVGCATMRERIDPAAILRSFQSGSPHTAIIGGVAGDQILIHSCGRTEVMTSGVVGLALKGDVPLTALVSRGCKPVSAKMQARGLTVTMSGCGGRTLEIPELVGADGSTKQPRQVALQAHQSSPPGGPLYVGLRLEQNSGYMLEQLSQRNFSQEGGMCIPFGDQGQDLSQKDCDICFFQLDAAESRRDLTRLLGFVRQQCEESSDQVLGAVMFTCSGRTSSFFGEDHADAKQFKAQFPDLPLVGFWAGGEIGPQAVVEASPAEATRTGCAALQGFTAVFGIFRAPALASRSDLMSFPDEQASEMTGNVLAQLASEAKNRGNALFQSGDHPRAKIQYTRAADLASVPSAKVTANARATFYANRAIVGLKLHDGVSALADAEVAVALDPLNVKAHYRRALALQQLGRPEEALSSLRQACDTLPTEAELSSLLKDGALQRALLKNCGM